MFVGETKTRNEMKEYNPSIKISHLYSACRRVVLQIGFGYESKRRKRNMFGFATPFSRYCEQDDLLADFSPHLLFTNVFFSTLSKSNRSSSLLSRARKRLTCTQKVLHARAGSFELLMRRPPPPPPPSARALNEYDDVLGSINR